MSFTTKTVQVPQSVKGFECDRCKAFEQADTLPQFWAAVPRVFRKDEVYTKHLCRECIEAALP